MALILIASILCCTLNVTAYFLMRPDPWCYSKLNTAVVCFVVFGITIVHYINHSTIVQDTHYSIIAIILMTEQTITAAGQIVRQIDLRKQRELWRWWLRRE